MRLPLIALLATSFAAPAFAQSPVATVIQYHNAAQAEMSCTGKTYTSAQEDQIAVMVLNATNQAVLTGDELAAIYASRPFMRGRISSLGCNDAGVVAARNFARERSFPAL